MAPKPKEDATFNVHQAKTHLSRILVRVQAGETVVIAKAGRPVAKLVPVQTAPAQTRVPGRLKGRVTFAKDAFEMSDEIADLFEAGG